MAVVREDGRVVNSRFIDEHFGGRSVLLSFNGRKFPVGQGHLAYSSNASGEFGVMKNIAIAFFFPENFCTVV